VSTDAIHDRKPEPVDEASTRGSPTEAGIQPNGSPAAGQLAPGLWLVATPIGNLGDISARARQVLAAADLVVCEDTRVTAALLRHLGISRPLQSYHEHNAARVRPELLRRLAAGERIALVSDAGTPAIADPGFKLVREAVSRGIPVRTVPGPSAVIAALSVSGLPTDRFLFEGFLPAKAAARRRRLAAVADLDATLVVFEAPHRIAATLADMVEILGDRDAALARELTKLHEQVVRGRLSQLRQRLGADIPQRGEFVVVVGPPCEPSRPTAAEGEEARALLRTLLKEMSLKEAVARAALRLALPKRQLYALALQLRESEPQ
jgi:16S rRNA (cytidine1402-2'-O)-methyltransferase